MNEINHSIQGPEVTIMDATEKITSFLGLAANMEEESRVRYPCKLSNAGGSALPRWS
jgi:hypothetical protein